jgi:hypothetical protein
MSTKRLGDYIERVMGPVRASQSRKDRMREELFAHLAGRFEEERGRLGDDGAAAERAIQRLGESGDLTRSLQDSVPWLERILCTPLHPPGFLGAWEGHLLRRDDETVRHFAVRITVWMTAAIAGADFVGCLAAIVEPAHPIDWSVALVWAAASLVILAAGTFVGTFLCEGMVRALRCGSPRRMALYAASSSLMVMALLAAFVLMVSLGAPHGQVFRRSDGLWLLPVVVLAPPIILILAARDRISRLRRRDRWGLPEMTS